jgi:glycosyltransferase involved in cell wall biosynthesis
VIVHNPPNFFSGVERRWIDMVPSVSVVIPVFNGELTIADCLRALETQSISKDDYEVIAVVDGSTDCSAQIAKGFKVNLIEQKERRGAPAARNVGIRAARGEWVAFTDDDCIPSRGWLMNLLRRVGNDERTLGAAGSTVGYQSRSAPARFVDMTCGFAADRHLSHPNFPFAPSANVMYRRSALKTVHGFDERYSYYDACDLHYRLLQISPGSFYFEPRAVVFHRHRCNWRDYGHQQFGYGQGLAEFMLHHRVTWSVWRELCCWGDLMTLGFAACKPGDDDYALMRRGRFVKQLAQRLGFIGKYWNVWERRKW